VNIEINVSAGIMIFTVITLTSSAAYCVAPYIDFGPVLAISQDDQVNDSFGNGYGFVADCGIKKERFCFGLGFGYRLYFDRGYYGNYEYSHRSKIASLSLYNLNFSIRSNLMEDQSGTSIFWGVGAGLYISKWHVKKASFWSDSQQLYMETGQRKFPGFEFQLGFEIPIDRKISIKSTLNYSYLVTDIRIRTREYRYSSGEPSPMERESTKEYRGINLGGKLLGIGLTYRL
jgi:hypothetical protein